MTTRYEVSIDKQTKRFNVVDTYEKRVVTSYDCKTTADRMTAILNRRGY